MAERVIVVSDRPARIRADIAVPLAYPRHRDDPKLVRLRRDVLGQLGLGTNGVDDFESRRAVSP